MSNGDYRTLVSPTYHKTLIFALELTVCFSCRIGNFAQYSANAPVAFSGAATFSLAGALIVSRTHACPRRQTSGAAKLLHIRFQSR